MIKVVGFIGYHITYCCLWFKNFVQSVVEAVKHKAYLELTWENVLLVSDKKAKYDTVGSIGYWK